MLLRKVSSKGRICPSINGKVVGVMTPESYLKALGRETILLWDKKFAKWKNQNVLIVEKDIFDITPHFFLQDTPCNDCYEAQLESGMSQRTIAFPEEEINWID